MYPMNSQSSNFAAKMKIGSAVAIVLVTAFALLTGCNVQPNLPASAMPSAHAESEAVSGSGNPNASFKGCWEKQGSHRYQAVDISVGTAGTYSFNALLYYGATCNKNDKADQFGYDEALQLGHGSYIFWFTAFANHPKMSALWYLGDQVSQCVSYADAPDCP
jgi:hypothetical protein